VPSAGTGCATTLRAASCADRQHQSQASMPAQTPVKPRIACRRLKGIQARRPDLWFLETIGGTPWGATSRSTKHWKGPGQRSLTRLSAKKATDNALPTAPRLTSWEYRARGQRIRNVVASKALRSAQASTVGGGGKDGSIVGPLDHMTKSQQTKTAVRGPSIFIECRRLMRSRAAQISKAADAP